MKNSNEFKEVLSEVCEEELDSLIEEVPHKFSDNYEKKIDKLLKQSKKTDVKKPTVIWRYVSTAIAGFVIIAGWSNIKNQPDLKEWENNENQQSTFGEEAFVTTSSPFRTSPQTTATAFQTFPLQTTTLQSKTSYQTTTVQTLTLQTATRITVTEPSETALHNTETVAVIPTETETATMENIQTTQIQTNPEPIVQTTGSDTGNEITRTTTYEETGSDIMNKKFVAFVAAVSLMMPNASVTTFAEGFEICEKIASGEINADVNFDGKIDCFDSYEILRYYGITHTNGTAENLGDIDIWNAIEEHGDIDGDGEIDATDTTYILQYMAYTGFKFESLKAIQNEAENYRNGIYKDDIYNWATTEYEYFIKSIKPNYATMQVITFYDNGKRNSDFNGDGVFDYLDIFELYNYSKIYRDCVQAYGTNSKNYDELMQNCYSDTELEQIKNNLGGSTFFKYLEVNETQIDWLAYYYYYNGNEFPEQEVMEESFADYGFMSADGAERVEDFYSYVNNVKDRIAEVTEKISDIEYTDEQLKCFTKLDSGELLADVNGDGVFDYTDVFDINRYRNYEFYITQNVSENIIEKDGYVWNRVAQYGDINGDGQIDWQDEQMLIDYFYYRIYNENEVTTQKSLNNSEQAEILENMLDTTVNVSLAGDANCDGHVTLADAVAVMQYIANAEKYPLSEQGIVNADVYNKGDGITAMDALEIQKLNSQS